ncbi:MAG: DUF2336 domain-containing protein [Proteobacteria bacterium]|nr:DUF2336 domain-containing protein [Pseudomonadota bacterium]
MSKPRHISYDEAKRLARDPDLAKRVVLARRRDLRPEILYYLAEDAAPEVRRVVAVNPTAPHQANLLLARDRDEEVRTGVAGKLARIFPGLGKREIERLHRTAYEALDALARDELVRVRKILAEALKDVAHAPHEVINRLARDPELEVSVPVLELSPVLTDEDLVGIIESTPASGALSAISRRTGLAQGVADAIVATDDVGAITSLLANRSAQIREETLDFLIDRAPTIEAWHEPLVRRPRLSPGAALKLAHFVADSLIQTLQARADVDPATLNQVAAAVRRRLDAGPAAESTAPEPPVPAARPKPTAPPKPRPAGTATRAAAASADDAPAPPPPAPIACPAADAPAARPPGPEARAGGAPEPAAAAPALPAGAPPGAEPAPSGESAPPADGAPSAEPAADEGERGHWRETPEQALKRATQLRRAGRLDENVLYNALADDENNFVVAGLALLAELPVPDVERIIFARDPKGVVALAWKAGISMRFAIKLQAYLADIPAAAVLKDDGFGGYPLEEAEIRDVLAALLAE